MRWLDKWLGAKAASGVGSLVTGRGMELLGAGSGSGFPRGYKAQVETVFTRNPVGYRAVRLVAGAVGGLAIDAHGEAGTSALALVARDGFLETVATHMLLGGNAYVQALPGGEEAPGELHALRPERVSVTVDAKGWPSAFLYRAGGGVKHLPARDALGRRAVAHIRAFDPMDDHYGLGSLDAAVAAASVHNAASKWNKALLDNAARPSGALVHSPQDGTVLSDSQFTRLKEELRTQYEGSVNAGRPLLLDGGLEWQAFSMTPADMEFIKLKEAAAREIALAFGVPPVLLGLPGDSTYANGREAGRALYRQTVLPLARRILGALSDQLEDWVGQVRFEVDEDQLSELAEDRAKLWAALNDAEFLSRDEKRAMLGFEAEGGTA